MSKNTDLIAQFEQALCDTYALSHSTLNDEENMFALGVDSMFLMRMVSQFRRLGCKVSLKQLYQQTTLGDVRALLGSYSTTGNALEPKAPTSSFPCMTDGQPFPMTPVQHAYYVGRSPNQPLGGNGCHLYQEFDAEKLDPDHLEQALNTLLERHPMLRVAFQNDGMQRWLAPTAPLKVIRHNLTNATEEEVENTLLDLRARLSHRPLNVQDAQTIEFHCSLLPQNRCRVHASIDLLVMDAASFSLFFNELSLLLQGMQLPPLTKHYDFCSYLAQEKIELSASRRAAATFWAEQIDSLPTAPKLPLAQEPNQIGKPQFHRRSHILSQQQWATFQHHASTHQITPTMMLATAYSAVLSRWSGQTDLLLNLTLFDCHSFNDDVQHLLADFTNILLLDMHLEEKSIVELAQAHQQRFADIYEHRHHSGVEVLRQLKKQGTHPHGAPIVFTSNLNRSLFGDDLASPLGQPGWGISQTPQVWLDFVASKHQEGILLQWDSVDTLFPAGFIDTLFTAFIHCIEHLVSDDANWAQPLPDLLPEQQKQQRRKRTPAPTTLPEGLLHERIFAYADHYPARLAMVHNEQMFSFESLTYRAKCLANTLINAGLEKDERVAISMEKGPGQVIAALAILYAGGIYVPIAPDQPILRRQAIIDSANIRFVLRCQTTLSHYEWTSATHFEWQDASHSPLLSSPHQCAPTDTAYIIYTSGSTGTPKGVVISHLSALNTCIDINQRHQINENDRVLSLSALHFDLSVYDIFGVLSAGGALIIPLETQRRDPMAWSTLVDSHKVTLWNTVPALFDMFLTYCEGMSLNTPAHLNTVLLSGDWVDLSLPERYRRFQPQGTFSAMGGATEAAIWSNEYWVEQVAEHWRSIPYGYPLSNQAYRVVDSAGRDCPDWVVGELWIGGVGVAQGYWNDPERTAAQFVEDHDSITGLHQRWYRTGDMGCYWPDGTLEFLGRQDTQVKVGGYRIELGDIDAALNRIDGVRHGVSLALSTQGGKDRQLEAFVVTEGDSLCEVATPAANLPSSYKDLFPTSSASADQVETDQVARFLQNHLFATISANQEPYSLETWSHSYGVIEVYQPLFSQWWSLLCQHGLAAQLESDYQLKAPVTTYPNEFETAADFTQASELLKAIMTGDTSASALLDSPLSPEALLTQNPAFQAQIIAISNAVSQLSAQLGRPVILAEFDSRSGRVAEALLEACGPKTVEYHAMDASLSLVQSATDRLSRFSHAHVHHWDGNDQHPLCAKCDIVLINNVLHRVTKPQNVLSNAQKLVTSQGLMIVLEISTLEDGALISAQVIQPELSALPTQSELLSLFENNALRVEQTLDHSPFIGYALRNQSPVLIANSERLKAKLSEHLPPYMLPKRIHFLSSLPLSANGKVDRKQLSQHGAPADEKTPLESPLQTDNERIVAQVWHSLFPKQAINRSSDFFLLGGDSLMATRCIGELKKLGYIGELTDLFTHTSLESFALKLSPTKVQQQLEELIPNPEERYRPFPMNEVQQAYWIGRQSGFALGETSAQFFVEFRVAKFDASRFNHAINCLIERHDALRTVIRNHLQQVLIYVPTFSIRCHSFADIDCDEANLLRTELSHRVNDPAFWPLFTAEAIVSPNQSDARLCIGLDNMMLDGLSMQIFFSELEALYLNPQVTLPELELTFRDVIQWQQAHRSPHAEQQAKSYWQTQLKALPAAPALPLQADPATLSRTRFIRASETLSAEEWQALKAQASQYQLTPSLVLMGAYAATLAAWGRQSSLTLNLTLFDRPDVHPQIGQVLGDFTTLLLLAWHSDSSWLDSLKRLQNQLAQDLKHNKVSAVWVMRELAKQQQLSNASMPVVFTSALGTSDGNFLSNKGWLKPVWGISQTPQVWLDHQVYESEGQLCLNWDAVEALLPQTLLDQMFGQYIELLKTLANQPQSWSQTIDKLLSGDTPSLPPSVAYPTAQRLVPQAIQRQGEPEKIQRIQAAFQQIVSAPIGENDNFFDAGASSLQLVQLHGLLTQQGDTLSVTDLFTYPSPALLASSYLTSVEQVEPNTDREQRQQRQALRKLARRKRVN
ncbi:TPA: amino acid adenylation domain-containing protein [Vibrio parahaemolyticus]|nr:amino acid adenylation domain-containing protein [Vibrio parahaemolyticus]MDF4971365.1 non-ribosomal peptide synthetase [Vibrio parahaemolyticus]HCE3226384.1 amino acid adenylation domain-containing protein [Vibrio parahaemolyticus]HCE3694996.1 amino acid adenylation domain-containing protein [Vibrio parahaemolyticus]HCG7168604.1 amino acid adenylation domain-containing protein [Vibrio parahaemolyticus]